MPPIYEFKCSECGESFDRILPVSKRNDVVECPKCGSKETNRQFTAPGGFLLKGEGFHKKGFS